MKHDDTTNSDVRRCGLSTHDNPFNPITQFDQWLQRDIELGYNTCAYLARIAHTSDELTDEENEMEIERAIDEIIRLDPFNIYVKVYEN